MTNPVETAWKIHSAHMDWTGRADSKAGFVLTLNAAIVATGVALSSEGLVFHNIGATWHRLPYGISLLLSMSAALLAAWAVAPSLRPGNLEREARSDFIYFGHARHWHALDLVEALEQRDPLPVVTRQVVRMANIAWRKHRRVAWATWLTVASIALMALTGWALS